MALPMGSQKGKIDLRRRLDMVLLRLLDFALVFEWEWWAAWVVLVAR
jgi:hypothetical protein